MSHIRLLLIVTNSEVQHSLFDSTDRGRHAKLMEVIDSVNSGFTRSKLTLAVQETRRTWKLKQEKLLLSYTTRLSDILKVK